MLIRRFLQADSLLILVVCVWYLMVGSLFAWFGYGCIVNVLMLAAIPAMGLWVARRKALWGRFLVIVLLALLLLLIVNCGGFVLLRIMDPQAFID